MEGKPEAESVRRQRAPTITIDTSAALQTSPVSQIGGDSTDDRRGSAQEKRTDVRLPPGSQSSNPRPVSAHNVSSPASGAPNQSFLSVPQGRSRGSSLDSHEAASPSSYGGDTYAPSLQTSQKGTGDVERAEDIIADANALKADPGNEAEFNVDGNPFAFTPGQLNKLLNPTSLGAFYALGGLRGLEKGLRTNHLTGISVDEDRLPGTISFEEATDITGKLPNKNIEAEVQSGTTDEASEHEHFSDRKRVFADNRLPEKKAKSIWRLLWEAYNDKVLILLTAAAVVSLALGIYQSVDQNSQNNEQGAHVEWVEGVAIIVAILIVTLVGGVNDWQKEKQFIKLNRKKEDRAVKVIRSGKSREISVHDVLAGDVLHLEPGDLIPADGIFISGHGMLCDESSATGESDMKRKTPGQTAFNRIENRESLRKIDPFIISGGKVNEGVGTYLVTSTGIYSSYGKTMMSLQGEDQTTPLQGKLNNLAEYIAKLGLAAGLLLFIVTFIEFLARLRRGVPDSVVLQYLENNPGSSRQDVPYGAKEKAQGFIQVFIVAVTIVVVAVPEGLPLAVTLALAYATTRMLKDNNLVRLLRACETMGNATSICSDKTGTLTQNKMTVVAGAVGIDHRFSKRQDAVSKYEDQNYLDKETDPTRKVSNEIKIGKEIPSKEIGTKKVEDKISSMVVAVKALDPEVKEILKQSIVFNTTAFEGNPESSEPFIGSKTETALLSFARDYLGMGSLEQEKAAAEIVQLVPFDSGRKCMATAIRCPNGKYRLFVKGASEILLSRCESIVEDPTRGTLVRGLDTDTTDRISDVISDYASKSLRTIGINYREFKSWPPNDLPKMQDEPTAIDFDKSFRDMTWLAVVGIQDPLRDGVNEAVQDCQTAGIVVRMVTGDNINTAKAIATECGIFTAGGIVMEGPQFRKMSKTQMKQVIPRLQVLARSSPEDKRVLVKRLREMGETVAVTGDGTNDAPALKTADVGFSMGISGTEVAKEASAIILMDDNFASIVRAMMWGRAVNDAVQKFLQFQITVNITAVFLTFISAVVSEEEQSVLTAVQLLWVNLIMDTFAALALATDPPTRSIINRKPQPRSAPLITLTMWKMIIGQSIFQLVVTLVLFYAGPSFLSFAQDSGGADVMASLVFNSFVWMQIFNQWNCRRLDNKLNFLEGIQNNRFFLAIQVIICGGQILIIFKGGAAFAVTTLNGTQWGISVIIGLLSIPCGMLIRLIPDNFIRACIPNRFKRKNLPTLMIDDEEHAYYEWNPALEDIKDELIWLKAIRGGRLSAIKHKLKNPRQLLPRSRSPSVSGRDSSRPHSPRNESTIDASQPVPESKSSHRRTHSRPGSAFGPATAMAGIVAGSIGGWSPIERKDGDGFGSLPIRSREDLEGFKGVEIHPGTSSNDPVLADLSLLKGRPPSQVPEVSPAPVKSD